MNKNFIRIIACAAVLSAMAGCTKAEETARNGKIQLSVGNWPDETSKSLES